MTNPEKIDTQALVEAVDELSIRLTDIGGCTDGNCRVVRPDGLRTNGGCRCFRIDKYKAERVVWAYRVFADEIRGALRDDQS